jgi:hypothetical protein
MAVEVAKLSLWLISLDPEQPFTFLDDRLVSGDSLIGVTSTEQIEELHFDAVKGRRLRERWIGDPTAGVRKLIGEVASARRQLADLPSNTIDAVKVKRAKLADILDLTARATLFADLVSGAFIRNADRRDRDLGTDLLAVADLARRLEDGRPEVEEEARALAYEWSNAGRPFDAPERRPLHWPLVFPEVFERGGFDAVVGNQPYLGGQKLTGTLGRDYREFLVKQLGGGVRGSADYVAYVVLQSHQLLQAAGLTGIIATNTLAQGDTREVGLDRLEADGVEIRHAVKSTKWPSRSSNLQVCIVGTSKCRLAPDARRTLGNDRRLVRGVATSLDVRSRVSGPAYRLLENAGTAFQGSIVLGLGFTVEPARAHALVRKRSAQPRRPVSIPQR